MGIFKDDIMKKIYYILILSFATLVAAQAQDLESQLQDGRFEKKPKVEIYPNPAIEFVFIDMNNVRIDNPIIKLYNIIGNVMEVPLERVAQSKYKLDVNAIPAGYYLISIQDKINTSDKYTRKFLKR